MSMDFSTRSTFVLPSFSNRPEVHYEHGNVSNDRTAEETRWILVRVNYRVGFFLRGYIGNRFYKCVSIVFIKRLYAVTANELKQLEYQKSISNQYENEKNRYTCGRFCGRAV